ncbi:hypothetical protein [Geobacter pickeringii]|uniref:Uncharacterized protein n=1 Tax=Geobacter pickeringii TaxID=345632 RepID=A0A0B5B633_9BACT|nr:hypothetical protein [Geobacter pickeringii]AJE02007.1 hypothetical protein GPICK_00235 [Geobacter pickeringii]
MELTIDEHKLIVEFRRLGPAGRKQLLDHLSLLLTKGEPENDLPPADRCALQQEEERPEASGEPIFTE